MKIKNSLLSILLVFLGSGFIWGQTQENLITYNGFDYTFVEAKKNDDGLIYCVGRNLDLNVVNDFRLFVLNEELEIIYVEDNVFQGPIGLQETQDSLFLAHYNNSSNELILASVNYKSDELSLDTISDRIFIDHNRPDSSDKVLFGYIQLKQIDNEFVGLLASEGSVLVPNGLEYTYYFHENESKELLVGLLDRYHPFRPPPDFVTYSYDFNIYHDSLYLLRSWSSASIYDKDWNLVTGRYNQGVLYNQGFILPYGDKFMSFGRVGANSENPFNTVPIVTFLDDDFNVIKVDSFWSPNERFFGVPSWYKGLTYNPSQDTFYACATQGWHWFFNLGIIDTSAQVYVRAYDDQMNNLWEMVIGDTLHHVSVLKIERMPDGNLMLMGSEASPESKYKFRPLLIEIDPSGTVVSTTNPVPIQSMDVSLYPNPVGNQLFLDWKGEDLAVDVQIVNASGQEVQQLQHVRRESAIDVARLSSGMYYLILSNDGKMLKSKPFVKGGR
ncbi:MAG: T9SS type A sorting domain-containing protein [Bacteroidetes bacterium]|jgi:hypothetical protein|nr:T9SS type A sorting domain-containing protein [Bacteroidota bacterium]